MTANQLSCGLLVINDRDELLLGHSTGSGHWDLPKGLIDLGRHAYYRGKDLHLFAVSTTSTETRLDLCRCTSYFEHHVTGQRVPEVDGFAWVDDARLHTRLAKSMRKLLLDKALLAHARTLAKITSAPD